jgi:mannan endo-1,4-beta-mannosidase
MIQTLSKFQLLCHAFFVVTIQSFLMLPLQAQTLVTSVEAEIGTRAGGLIISTAISGYSGSGYVTNMANTGDNLTIPVTVPTAGSYKLVIRYNGPYGAKDQDIYVNGVFVSNLHFPATTGYTDLTAGSLMLNAGNNTISIYKNWGYTDFDKITLYTVPLNDYTTVASAPIDPLATTEAVALYNYLKSNYGQKVISGQTYDYYSAVSPNASKSPVIKAYDFQHYTVGYPYLWNTATAGHTFGWEDDGTTQAAIDWYNSTCQKGIVAFQWHWHSPSGGQPGVNTFSTSLTNFDVTKAVTQGTSEYTAVIRDIDSIATQLKRFQAAGVPVLWRPLHEAGGAWFWWGAKGPAAALKLYDMVYDRLVNHHGIHNLIWQWSTPEPNWYPGNAKVDMLGYDSYPGPYNYGTQKLIFDQLYTITNGKKMLALTENGPIPDPDAIFLSDAKWSYFMSWSDLATKQNSAAHLSLVYNHEKVITLDEVTTATNTAQVTASGPTTFCSGGSVLLKANVAKGYTYKWYNGTNVIIGATTSSYTATTAGSYTVAVTATGACTTTSSAIVVTIAGPTATITPATATTFCQGGNVILTASTGSSYKWMLNGNAINGGTNVSHTANASGSYTVEVTNANNCKALSVATTVTVNALPAATITAGGATTFCQGGNVILTASTGSSYKWMLNGNAINGGTNVSHTANASGSYTVEVTNANNCKALSAATTVTVNALPTATMTLGPGSTCQSYLLTASAGTSYKWFSGGNVISGATGSSYEAPAGGSYAVEVTNAVGCKAISTTVPTPIAIIVVPTITAAGSRVLCGTESVVLTSSAGSFYQWNLNGSPITGATEASFTARNTGQYSVTVVGSGCSATSANVEVTVVSMLTWYLDKDGDGIGDVVASKQACAQPSGYVPAAGDACPDDANKIDPGNCGCGVTENSCLDCMGVPNGTAALDVCNVCAGGTSDVTPKTNISQCITTSTKSALATNIKMYPNPSFDNCKIELSGSEFHVDVYTVSGILVSTGTFTNEAIIGNNLPQGIYLIRIEQDGNLELQKLVKQ